MTTMIESEETVAVPRLETMERRNRGLGLAVVILAILVLALGAWTIYDFSQGAATAPSAEMTQFLDDYDTAWNNYDGEAFLALTTAGYKFTTAGGREFRELDQAFTIGTTLPMFAWQFENLGEPIVTGHGPWYVSTAIQTTTNIREADGHSILTVVDIEGVLQVSDHRIIGDF
ncbi:MAG: hypothetical protein V3U46_02355 [Acidimicrobiia bacterium]